MQPIYADCATCERLCREFAAIAERYVTAIAANPIPIDEVVAARAQRDRILSEVREHEWAAHGGEPVLSAAL